MSLYITTPIFYVNARPHLGHAYTAIIADTVARYRRLAGEDVFFQTGTDEHGDKIVQAAAGGNAQPREYADEISGLFRAAWPPLEVEPDNFIRTTDQNHIETVQAILQKVYEQGDIYFSRYAGLYCKGCERFLTDRELQGGLCPDHLTEPEPISEENYFFRMSSYQGWLIEHINSHPDFITPERYRNEVLSFLKEPLEDLCISRPVSRLTWGIPLPFDKKFVTYVWFDALINYLTGIGYPDGSRFSHCWSAAEHVIAKDILKPHAVYWPTMLRSLGLPPFRRLRVHGYWNVNDTKMSKSLGNIVGPEELTSAYGADTVRYFLLREMSFGLDASFSREAVVARQNSDLANDLGNLFSRSLTMVGKFAGSVVPEPGESADSDKELAEAAIGMLAEYGSHMDDFAFNRALQSVWDVIGKANRYIVANAPWELAKDPEKKERLGTVLYTLLETLRLITLPLFPVMPQTAGRMAEALGIGATPNLDRDGRWGLLKPNTAVSLSQPLFPRIDKNDGRKKDAAPEKEEMKHQQDRPSGEEQQCIDFAQFQALDLRVGEVVAAERVPKSNRLLKLTVRTPEERTVVAGIAEQYRPEELIGKSVIVLVNLRPAKLMGISSHGMVLAAKDGGKLTLLTTGCPMVPGSKVS